MALGLAVSLLILLATIAVPVVVIRYATRPGQSITGEDVRQFFQYALLYGLVIIVGIGATQLLGRALGQAAPTSDTNDSELAQGLGFVVVGLPLLVLLIWWLRRGQVRGQAQQRSMLYALYLSVAALSALLVAAFALGPLLGKLFTGRPEGGDAATVLVWGLIWFLHWRLADRTLTDSQNAPHLLLGSTIAVLFAASGFVTTIEAIVRVALPGGLLVSLPVQVLTAAGVMSTGALIWVRYWVSRAQNLARDQLWMLFVLPLGVGGGLLLAVFGAGAFSWEVLTWIIGTRVPTAESGFAVDALGQLAAAIAGLLIWWYFRTILGSRVEEDPSARRTYLYLVSGIALAAAGSGAATVIGASIQALAPSWNANNAVMNTLLGGVVLLGIGGGLWLVFWRRLQRLVRVEPTEATAPGRRGPSRLTRRHRTGCRGSEATPGPGRSRHANCPHPG